MSDVDAQRLTPPLKWAGGKRWLAIRHREVFPTEFETYIEPFLGGGAIFFTLKPEASLLSDVNPHVISMYNAIKDDHERVYDLLSGHADLHSDEYYYKTRGKKPINGFELAAWMLYLNRTCFNGLYRVNRRGEFNVPRGTKNKILFDYDNFSAISEALDSAEIFQADFEVTISRAGSGDFLYLDPPYTVRHNNNGFVRYNENMFSWADQERLSRVALEAASRGAKVLISNADHLSIRELYAGKAEIQSVDRHTVIGGGADYRSMSSEVLIKIGF